MQEREQRISRTFTVRINADVTAPEPRWDIVTAKDLSASGVLFNYNRYIEPGTQINFKISLPFNTGIECVGEVVRNMTGTPLWSGRAAEAVCGVAVVFSELAEEDQIAMREFLENCHVEAERVREEAGVNPSEGKPPRAKRVDRSYYTRIRENEDQDWELVKVQNISESGISFRYDRLLDVDSELLFSIALPLLLDLVDCRGTVVRVEDQTPDDAEVKSYGIGVCFSGMDESVAKALREHSEKHGRN
jgi:hypothetical protein